MQIYSDGKIRIIVTMLPHYTCCLGFASIMTHLTFTGGWKRQSAKYIL